MAELVEKAGISDRQALLRVIAALGTVFNVPDHPVAKALDGIIEDMKIDFDDMRGILPRATGNESSEDYVRRLRDTGV